MIYEDCILDLSCCTLYLLKIDYGNKPSVKLELSRLA
jgi:hypothetical protein